jgi:hypothetical protein
MQIEHVNGETLVGHGGGYPGVNTELNLVLNSPYTIVALANQDPPSADFASQMTNALVAKKAKEGK